MPSKERKLLFVANTVFEFFLVTSIARLVKNDRSKDLFHILLKPRVAKAIPDRLLSFYDKSLVRNFPYNPVYYGKKVKEWPRTIYLALRELKDSVIWSIETKRLSKEGYDLVVISSFREYFANILARNMSKSSTLIAVRMGNENIETLNRKSRPLASFIANVYNRLFGYSVMTYRFNEKYKGAYHNHFHTSPYRRMIVIRDGLKNFDVTKQEISLPGPLSALSILYGNKEVTLDNKKILIVGERMPINPNWNSEGALDWDSEPQKRYNEFLDYMRKEFSGYEIWFIPKRDRTDISRLNLNGFKVFTEEVLLEELFAKERFEKVISIKSTVSKTATYFGYQSYVIYPLLKLSSEMERYSEFYFSDSKGIVHVREMSDLHKTEHKDIVDIKTISLLYSEALNLL